MRLLLALLGLCAAGSAAQAQDIAPSGPCTAPDSIAFRGNKRIKDDELRSDIGILPKTPINSRTVTAAVRQLYATNQFEDVGSGVDVIGGKCILHFDLVERRVLSDVKVEGTDHVSNGSVRDRVDLLIGKPVDPAQVTRDVTRIDSLYQAEGYYLAKVRVDTANVGDEGATITFHIDEGRRLAISGVEFVGNKALPAATIVHAISTKPEGFFW